MDKNKPYEAFRFPEFNLFISARFLITIAFAIQFLTIEWFVYQLTKNPLDLGLIALAEIIPAIGFSLISGHFIDKSEKRNSTLICMLGSFLTSVGFYFILKNHITLGENSTLLLLYSMVFGIGIIRAFFSPSVFALFALILPKSVYANGTTWSSSAWQIGAVIGPAIAGFLYAFLGAENCMLVTAVLLLICVILVSIIQKKEIIYSKSISMKESLKTGLNFVFNHKIVLSALTLDLFAVLFGGAIALLPVFIADEIIPVHTYSDQLIALGEFFNYSMDTEKVKSFAFGILRSAPAIGSIITMITIAYVPINKNTGIKLLISVFIFGLCILGFGLSELFWLSFGFLVISGIADGVSVVIRSTILQILTPDEMRGRVAAINTIFVGSSNELGAFESGVTAKWFGAVRAVVIGGCITCGVVFSSYFIFPRLKDFDLGEKD